MFLRGMYETAPEKPKVRSCDFEKWQRNRNTCKVMASKTILQGALKRNNVYRSIIRTAESHSGGDYANDAFKVAHSVRQFCCLKGTSVSFGLALMGFWLSSTFPSVLVPCCSVLPCGGRFQLHHRESHRFLGNLNRAMRAQGQKWSFLLASTF